jgi:hypothetical protein
MQHEYVTIVNRTSKVLQGVWDGRHYDLAPGKHQFARTIAEKFRAQHPIMGSEDPYNLSMLYLIGIEEDNDDCSPVEQSTSLTLQDISARLKSGEYTLVKGNGLFATMRDASPQSLDSTFVNPTV